MLALRLKPSLSAVRRLAVDLSFDNLANPNQTFNRTAEAVTAFQLGASWAHASCQQQTTAGMGVNRLTQQ